jgi:hypothetical protein
MNNILPEILDGLEFESQFIQRTSGAQRRVVKLNRGDSWMLRFLPAKLGPNGRWYARIAKHWVNQRAIVCPRHTEEAYGGNPEAWCSVCDLSAHLNDERQDDVSKFGFKLRATPNWVTYCAVFEKAVQGGQAQAMSLPEVLQPYEFAHYKTTWEELTGFVKAGVRRTPYSVLDFEKGNDFYVSKVAKGGMRLDKQDSAPIFDLNDPKFDEHCQKLIAACKDPVVKIPDEKAMDAFADKAQEEADNIARGRSAAGGRSGSRQSRDEDDLPPEDDAPSRGRRYDDQQQEAPATARGRGTTAAPAAAAQTRRAAAPVQQEATSARRAATSAPAAAQTRRAPAPQPEPEPEPEPEPLQEEGQGDPGVEGELGADPGAEGEQQPEEQQQPEPAAPLRRAPAAPAAAQARPSATRPSASRTTAPAPARAAAAPAPAPARAAAAAAPARAAAPRGGAVANESLDEEEHVPEEANDQAPPQPLTDPADDPGAGEAPPPVENTRRGQFASNIRGKIAAVNASAKK